MNICDANIIMKSLLDIPVINLNTKSFVLIQELKNIFDQMQIDFDNKDLQNNFNRLYLEFKQESESFKSSLKNLQNLHNKINHLEKNNQDLLKKINILQIDNLYLEGSDIIPTYGNSLIYNQNQNYFYVLFSSKYIKNKLHFNSNLQSENIIGWFYDTKGWRTIMTDTSNETLLVSKNIEKDTKNLNGGNKFYILDNTLFKIIIFKNNQIIPIFSNIKLNYLSMFNFKNIHQMYIYNSQNFIQHFNKEKLLHIATNILQWNIDNVDLNNIMTQNYDKIKENELLQPLRNDTIILQPNEIDISIWNNILSLYKEYNELVNFPILNIYSKSYNRVLRYQLIKQTKNYIIQNTEIIQKYLSDNEFDFDNEEDYVQFIQIIKEKKMVVKNEIIDFISKFPVREHLRKIDFFIECLKLDFSIINNFRRLIGKNENNINIFHSSLQSIKLSTLNKYPQENLMIDNKTITIWKNIIVTNIDIHFKNKIDTIFNYLIFYHDKIIDRNLKSVIDNLIIEYFTSNNNLKIINYIDIISEKLKLNVNVNDANLDTIKDILYILVKNKNIHTCIKNIDFYKLFSYGIHKILEKNKYLIPLQIDYANGNFYYQQISIKIKDLNILNHLNNKIIFNENGLSSGYCTLRYNNYEFSSTTNVYIIPNNNIRDVPQHFLYAYSIQKKIIFIHKNIYNQLILDENNLDLIGNITEFNSNFYKIPLSHFRFHNEIKIDNIILKMINGENLNYKTSKFEDIIELQNVSYKNS